MFSKKLNDKILYSMLVAIGLISLFDLYLAVTLLDPSNSSGFKATEKNPVIVNIVLLTGDFSIFIPCKIIGTAVSMFITKRIYDKSRKRGTSICVGVFIFQLLLLAYLAFGHLL